MNDVRLTSLTIGGRHQPWVDLGFAVDDRGAIPLLNGALVIGEGSGMTGLTVDHIGGAPTDVEGIPVGLSGRVPPADHPNGALGLDHLVMLTDSIERTSGRIADVLGLPLKRIRETATVRQGFHRFADESDARGCIVEVVEGPDQQRTALVGLVVNIADLHGWCDMIGPDKVGIPKAAVQPGRYIATVRSGVGLGVPVAFMTPD